MSNDAICTSWDLGWHYVWHLLMTGFVYPDFFLVILQKPIIVFIIFFSWEMRAEGKKYRQDKKIKSTKPFICLANAILQSLISSVALPAALIFFLSNFFLKIRNLIFTFCLCSLKVERRNVQNHPCFISKAMKTFQNAWRTHFFLFSC